MSIFTGHHTTLTKSQIDTCSGRMVQTCKANKVAYLLVMGLHGIQVSLEMAKGILAGVQLLLHACQLGLQSCLPGACTGMCLYTLHAGMSHLDSQQLEWCWSPRLGQHIQYYCACAQVKSKQQQSLVIRVRCMQASQLMPRAAEQLL